MTLWAVDGGEVMRRVAERRRLRARCNISAGFLVYGVVLMIWRRRKQEEFEGIFVPSQGNSAAAVWLCWLCVALVQMMMTRVSICLHFKSD